MVMNDMTDDGKAVLQPIDWTAAIEAVHEDGRVVPARIDGPMERSRGWKVTYNDGDSDWSWCVSNEGVTMAATSWRIRNVQSATQTQAQTLTAQEHLARLEALVRRMAALNPVTEVAMMHTQEFDEARALVAEMEPVVDGDLVEARRIAYTEAYSESLPEVLTGEYDFSGYVRSALVAIKRGRELERNSVS